MMNKVSIGTNATICPMPVTLIGSMVSGRPNFMTVAFIARINMEPPLLSMSLNKKSATREAVLETGVFSVNFPTAGMVDKADYCGIVSGKNTDKSGLFDIFYGALGDVPMIRECPLSFECKVTESHEFTSHTCIIGEIVATYLDESCFTDNKPDPKKINPLMLTMPDNQYWNIGNPVGKAWNAGRDLVT
ncbi:flavin reductase family protein [uncultured Methanospirillum sp.]|uniref:flavin reductase family protein n=1 Tax=uncultured Methanospirillum sp. TaxID=262503 RepID=UPI0029C71470|nr:flavin reductase family protein [uncultured Methanospirillum sp.]